MGPASDVLGLPDYANFDPASLQASRDLNREAFGGWMAEIEASTDPAHSWHCAEQAQRLLEGSASTEPLLWAHVLDKKRWASLALGQLDVNRAVCTAMVQRLDGLHLMAFDSGDQAVSEMLAAAHHRLGAGVLDGDTAASDAAALQRALRHIERGLDLFGADDVGEGLAGYWDSRLRVLQALVAADAAQAPFWQARLARELGRVREMPDHMQWIWTPEGEALLHTA